MTYRDRKNLEGENVNTIEDAFAYEIYMAAALNSSQEKPTNNLHFSPSISQHKDVSGKNDKSKIRTQISNERKRKHNQTPLLSHFYIKPCFRQPSIWWKPTYLTDTTFPAEAAQIGTRRRRGKKNYCLCLHMNMFSCQFVISLATPTLDLSTMRTLYCSYTLARFSAHHCSACFSLNRFRLHFICS